MSEFEFKPWPKIFRLFGPAVISEKIDGTNAAIHIKRIKLNKPTEINPDTDIIDYDFGTGDASYIYRLGAQSRKRIITPGQDNFGFAAWVHQNRLNLAETLGEGIHFGEWYGRGINRGYDMNYRAFALFNTKKWQHLSVSPQHFAGGSLTSVPVLIEVDSFQPRHLEDAVEFLTDNGSQATDENFSRPEGVVVYWPQADHMFKYTPFDGDGNKARLAQEKAHNAQVRKLEEIEERAAVPEGYLKPELISPMTRLGRLLTRGDSDSGETGAIDNPSWH